MTILTINDFVASKIVIEEHQWADADDNEDTELNVNAKIHIYQPEEEEECKWSGLYLIEHPIGIYTLEIHNEYYQTNAIDILEAKLYQLAIAQLNQQYHIEYIGK